MPLLPHCQLSGEEHEHNDFQTRSRAYRCPRCAARLCAVGCFPRQHVGFQ
ncbi:hypothetical protein GC175_08465 [bacterium]|nr:hypothetical protein [bacterium]